MPLRTPNNPLANPAILGVLAGCLNQDAQGNYNTQLAQSSQSGTGKELVFVQQKYKMAMALKASQPYAVLLSPGKQHYTYGGGPRARMGLYEALVQYYGRWDVQPTSIDAIWAAMDSDLVRMQANIENNDSLVFGSVANAMSVPSISLSPYEGQFDHTFSGLVLPYRTMTLSIEVLPYDC